MSEWQRIEPSGRDEHLEEGLQARVADPLWMLSRQWQLGEFRGEDAASPIHARAIVRSMQLTSFRNHAEAGAAIEALDHRVPLECRVEAESVLDGPAAIQLAAEAGTQFLRRLDHAGLTHVRAAIDWPARFPFDLLAEGIDLTYLPARAQRRLTLLAARGLDGRTLHNATSAQLTADVDPVDHVALLAVWDAWKLEYADRLREPGSGGDTWVDERLEYSFSIAAPTSTGDVVLAADEYHGGHLDWYAFRLDLGDTHGLSATPPTQLQLERLPMPVTYRGQPASRWWEFEDRTVYFGNLEAGPADLARLIVAEFGAVFSDDWFVIPLELPVGTLNRVHMLRVLDVFGELHDIAPTAVNDYADFGAARPWAFFELEGDTAAATGRSPLLLLPPVLTNSINAKPVERVTLVRDEAANLGWGIEQAIELPTGRSIRRRQQWTAAQSTTSSETWRYRVQTSVPPWWVPFIPEQTGVGADVRLRRGRMQGWEEHDSALVGAKGQLIGMARALRIYEEEVPRGGVEVTRGWQLARGADGRTHLWMARRKRPGRGDRGSGLEFDVIER